MQTSLGWRCLRGGSSSYMMKRSNEGSNFKIFVSNMIQVWAKESSADELWHIFQELNPLMECNDHAIIYQIWAMLDDRENSMDVLSTCLDAAEMDDGSLELNFETKMDGHKIKFYLNLSKQTPLVFFKEVTVPLLSAAEELVRRQDALCILLEKKDQEIQQYKLEGASLSRQNVETQFFSKADFLTKSHMQGDISSACEGVIKVLEGASFLSTPKIESQDKNVMDTDQPIGFDQQDDKPFNANSASKLIPTNLDVKFDEVIGELVESSNRENQINIPRKRKIKINL